MMEARIIGPSGSLYYSAPATASDLENLRAHVRDIYSASPEQVHIELTLGQSHYGLVSKVSKLVREFASKGIAVRVL